MIYQVGVIMIQQSSGWLYSNDYKLINHQPYEWLLATLDSHMGDVF